MSWVGNSLFTVMSKYRVYGWCDKNYHTHIPEALHQIILNSNVLCMKGQENISPMFSRISIIKLKASTSGGRAENYLVAEILFNWKKEFCCHMNVKISKEPVSILVKCWNEARKTELFPCTVTMNGTLCNNNTLHWRR